MRTSAEDAEVTEGLRTFDVTAARLLALGVAPAHLCDRVHAAGEDIAVPDDAEVSAPA